MRDLVREPLVHFVLLGAILFASYALLAPKWAPNGAAQDATIRVTDDIIAGVRADLERERGRPPDEGAVRDAVQRWIEDEVLVREARRRGLDRGDPIVRRRLVQTMRFFLEAEAGAEADAAQSEPTPDELATLLAEDPARYARPARLSFEHVYFSTRHHPDPSAAARQALEARGGGTPKGGEHFLHGGRVTARTSEQIASLLGGELAVGLGDLPTGEWRGPLQSAYGAHLVRVTERLPGALPELSDPDVRRRVREEWQARRREDTARQAIAALNDDYVVDGWAGP